jgi:hypothetical protein
MSKLNTNALESQAAHIRRMLERSKGVDPLGAISLSARLDDVLEQIGNEQNRDKNHAAVTLLFYGTPVDGSNGIDAQFAGRAIQEYQSALSKHMVSVAGGQLGARGPIPERNLSKLNITDVVHGSFGFQLEEASENEDMFSTALKQAVDDISDILQNFSAPEEKKFEDAIEKIDSRTFTSIKSFISLAHHEGASFRIIDDEEEFLFDDTKILRAYERVESVEFTEDISEVAGTLIGVIPIGRRFEFKIDGTEEVISGTIGKKLSADFIERIQQDEQFIGKRWSASFYIRTVTKPDGRVKVNYVLMDLVNKLD